MRGEGPLPLTNLIPFADQAADGFARAVVNRENWIRLAESCGEGLHELSALWFDGEAVRITSRRGSVVAPARIDPALRENVVFMTLHYPDDVATNLLTIDVADPKSGTAEFKACAVRVEPAELRS